MKRANKQLNKSLVILHFTDKAAMLRLVAWKPVLTRVSLFIVSQLKAF